MTSMSTTKIKDTKPQISTLKNIIQDLIEQGEVVVKNPLRYSNIDHTIFKDPLQNHNKIKASSLGNHNNKANYANILHEYMINHIQQVDDKVSTIKLSNKNHKYVVTTH